jgi:predicted secreted Zn-dependent protease
MLYKFALFLTSCLFLHMVQAQERRSALPVFYQSYPIDAKTPNDAIQAILTQAPKAPARTDSVQQGVILGWTTFEWGDVRITAQEVPSGCAIQQLQLDGRLVVFTPKLVKTDLQEWGTRFESFAQSIRSHEMKHVQLFQQGWQQLQREAQGSIGQTVPLSCAAFKEQTKQQLLNWPKTLHSSHQRLDAQEGHVNSEMLARALGL